MAIYIYRPININSTNSFYSEYRFGFLSKLYRYHYKCFMWLRSCTVCVLKWYIYFSLLILIQEERYHCNEMMTVCLSHACYITTNARAILLSGKGFGKSVCQSTGVQTKVWSWENRIERNPPHQCLFFYIPKIST